MYHAIEALNQADIDVSRKAKFWARCYAIKDSKCISKGFFDRLHLNRSRTSIASLTADDGTCITDMDAIVHECNHYFGKILSAPP